MLGSRNRVGYNSKYGGKAGLINTVTFKQRLGGVNHMDILVKSVPSTE